jgi:putative ABC transport system permease protein
MGIFFRGGRRRVDLALRSLLHDRVRFAITVAGVSFAVTLVLVQVGLFLGLLSNASVSIENADADLWVTTHNTPNVDFARPFPESYVDRVRSVPGVQAADNLIVFFMNVALPTGGSESVTVYGLEDFRRWRLPWAVREGDIADLRRGDYFMLDQSAEKRMGRFRVGEYREVGGRRLRIVGRTTGGRSFTTNPLAFMDYGVAQQIAGNALAGQTNYVLVKLRPGADTAAVKREIHRRLPYNDVHTAAEWASLSRMYWVTSTGLGMSIFLTVFLGCLVGVVVVAQTLYTSTLEHLKEFGTVKAIGGSNADIYGILLKQAGIAAVIGFAIGAVPVVLVAPLTQAAGLRLIIPPPMIGIVAAGTLCLCAAASMVSFRKVAGIDPALVFRS